MTPQDRQWREMLQAAARMGVAPEGFWRLSLKEWRMLTVGPVQAAPLGRGELERMSARWPDDMILPCAAGEGDHAQHGGGGEVGRGVSGPPPPPLDGGPPPPSLRDKGGSI